MRIFHLSALMLIIVLTLSQQQAQAQQSSQNPEKDSPLREKAYSALESLAGQLNTLQSAENRARLGANIAESLWKHDQTRARALFLLVQQDIKSHLTIPDFDNNQKEVHTLMVFLKLRSDTLERIAKYDPELAFSFFKETEVDLEKLPPFWATEQRNTDILVAQKLAAQSPELAIRFARESLSRGLSPELLNVLARLTRKHKEQATAFYREITAKLRKDEWKYNWDQRQMVATLSQAFQPPAIDETAYSELIAVLIDTAMANGCGEKSPPDSGKEFCRWLAPLMANIENIDSRAGRMKRGALPAEVDEQKEIGRMQVRQELNDIAQEGTVDDILALAEKYPEMVDDIYLSAWHKARIEGDLERLKKIANEYKGDPERGKQLRYEVGGIERAAKFDEEQLAALQARVNETKRIQERIWLLTSAAYRAGASNRNTALKLLNQAEQIVEGMSPGKEQTEQQIVLSIMYCLEKEERGFTIMESLVPKLNSLVDAAVKLDGYDTSYLREGEWNMSAAGSVGELLTRLAEVAQFYAWSDFDRAMSLAGQFERPEIRMMAQLKLAQGVLAGPHKRAALRGY